MNIASQILVAGREADAAIIQAARTVTYAELRRDSRAIACHLIKTGHQQGDRIALLAENSPFFVGAYLGIIQAGFVAVPLPTDCPADSFIRITASAQIRTALISKRLLPKFQAVAISAGVTPVSEEPVASSDPPAPSPAIDPRRELAALMFTSGSTGTPKGVMITHRNIECNTRDIISYMGLTASDRAALVLPLHYCFGLSLLHTHLMVGGSLVLCNDFRLFPETTLRDLIARECTGFAGVPSTFQLLLRKSRFRELQFPCLRWLQQAGGKLPNPHIKELISTFPSVRYYLMYGQTEGTARLSYLPPERLIDKLGSIGRGLPSTRLDVLALDGSCVTPGSEETGEIVATGENVSPGYWDDPEETARYFRDGRLHTGDIARVDSDGFIYIIERDRDIIKTGGNRVSAKEVEDVIAELPAIVEVAVVGMPHELLGESIVAFVVLAEHSALQPAEIRGHCRARLSAVKTPEQVILLRTMPHSSAGKIMKRHLREFHAPA